MRPLPCPLSGIPASEPSNEQIAQNYNVQRPLLRRRLTRRAFRNAPVEVRQLDETRVSHATRLLAPSRSTTTRRAGAGRPRIPSADRFDSPRAATPPASNRYPRTTGHHRRPTPPATTARPPRCNDSGERTVTKAPAHGVQVLSRFSGGLVRSSPKPSQVHEGASCSCRPLARQGPSLRRQR
jgi:hypothetical protein